MGHDNIRRYDERMLSTLLKIRDAFNADDDQYSRLTDREGAVDRVSCGSG